MLALGTTLYQSQQAQAPIRQGRVMCWQARTQTMANDHTSRTNATGDLAGSLESVQGVVT